MVMASIVCVHDLGVHPRVASQQGLSLLTIGTKPTRCLLNEIKEINLLWGNCLATVPRQVKLLQLYGLVQQLSNIATDLLIAFKGTQLVTPPR